MACLIRKCYSFLEMQTATGVISARSQRQALDWSLVLLSQGIESILEGPSEEHGWQLVIPLPEYNRALTTLQTYHRENSHRRWQQSIPWTGLLFDWRSVLWFMAIVLIFVAQTRWEPVTLLGVMDSGKVTAGEWWRLFTAVTLHANVSHLISNVSTGILLLGMAMGATGWGHSVLASFLAGGGANLMAMFLYPDTHRSLGASGMVMAALGILTAHSISLLRAGIDARQLISRAFLGGVLLFVLLGLNPDSDVLAHLMGFFIGAMLGVVISLLPADLVQSKVANRVTGGMGVMLVAACWILALS